MQGPLGTLASHRANGEINFWVARTWRRIVAESFGNTNLPVNLQARALSRSFARRATHPGAGSKSPGECDRFTAL